MFTILRTAALALAAVVAATPGALAADAAKAKPSDAISPAMYFHSQIRDAADCALTAQNGTITFGPTITSPAAQCPDAFAWSMFLRTIKAEFWTRWAYDQFTWPESPLPLCQAGETTNCCDPTAATNPGYDDADNPAAHCPYFPGDHTGTTTMVRAGEQVKAHTTAFNGGHGALLGKYDPGRRVRQEMAEVVFRNKPMWDYVFQHGYYHTDGLSDLFFAAKEAANAKAPYRVPTTQVSFPAGSVMFKTDWLHIDQARKLGIKPDGEHPYITLTMKSRLGDNDASRFKPGLHLLVAVTAASKDLPNWHWYAIEHVDNLGRCDLTGCNDSFGYDTAADHPKGTAANFTPPHMKSDDLETPAMVFDTGKPYESGTIRPALQKLFAALGVGQGKPGPQGTPTVGDPAWMSYRLKGTQTEFTTMDGIETGLGNSVTEGGFVQTSSCLTCHAQATVNAAGQPGIPSIGFARSLNLTGYAESTRGPSDPDWFYAAGTNDPTAVPFDFTWGILFASPLDKKSP